MAGGDTDSPRGWRPGAAWRWLAFIVVTALCAGALIALPTRWSRALFALLAAGSLLVAYVAWLLRRTTARAIWQTARQRAEVLAAVTAGLAQRARALLRRWLRALWRLTRRAMSGLVRLWRRAEPFISGRGGAALRRIGARQRRTPPPDVRHLLRPIHTGLLHLELLLIISVALYATREFATLDKNVKLYGYEGEWLTSSAHYAAVALHRYGYLPLWQPLLESGEPLLESPFSFVLNPFSTVPSLLLGGVNGIKISVMLTAVLAGLGGWTLGRVLGLGALGRVLLGLLLASRGNMVAMIGGGYFQLGTAQAYFPWIIAGTVGTLRFKHLRWPVALTAVAFTLLFLAGNVWYTLPMLLSLALLTALYTVDLRRRVLDWVALRRVGAAALLTVGLSAVLLLPIWANRAHIGGHPDDQDAGEPVDRLAVIEQFYNGEQKTYLRGEAPGQPHFYYSYVSPLWFILLVFVAFPLARPYRYPWHLRLWAAGLLLAGFGILWGVGGHPIMKFLYAHVPGLGQWRFVGRALALSSFWFAVLIALRVDALWCLLHRARWRRGLRRPWRWGVRAGQMALALGLLVASLAAARDVVRKWTVFAGVTPVDQINELCIEWLRKDNPGAQDLAMYRQNYDIVTVFLDNEVRLYNVEADYWPIPLASTLGHFDWTALLPRYATAWEPNVQQYLREQRYVMLQRSPDPWYNGYHCVYELPDTLSYAFTVPLHTLEWLQGEVAPERTTPLHAYNRLPDRIALWARAGETRSVVVVQERAYPGWRVTVDGEDARLESVGGLIGVILPPDGEWHIVRFAYRPPLFYAGSAIALAAAAFCALYLLNADRPARRAWRVLHPALERAINRGKEHGR